MAVKKLYHFILGLCSIPLPITNHSHTLLKPPLPPTPDSHPPSTIYHALYDCSELEINCIFLLVFSFLLLLPYKFPIKNLEITHEYNPFPITHIYHSLSLILSLSGRDIVFEQCFILQCLLFLFTGWVSGYVFNFMNLILLVYKYNQRCLFYLKYNAVTSYRK